jgi:O-succinylbenzoate-CoA ligase
MKNNIGLLIAKRARLNPQVEAVVEIERGRRFTYAELNARSNRVAHALIARGVRPGDRVALLQMNGVEYIESYFALARIGAVLVPLNWRLVADELEFIIGDSGAGTLIYDCEFAEAVRLLNGRSTSVRRWICVGATPVAEFAESYEAVVAGQEETEPDIAGQDDDLLFIMYTSGTTGRPKGAMHSHDTMLWNSITYNMTCDQRFGDRDLVVLPLFHIGGLVPLTAVLHRGATGVVMRSYDTRGALETIERERITTTLVVTTILRMLVEHSDRDRYDLSSLRWAIVGGEPVPIALLERCAELGIDIRQDYGQTESGMVTLTGPEEAARKRGSAGQPCVHTDVEVVDGLGLPVPPETPGEIVVRGRQVMKGYWNRPEATAEALREGWLHTGDVGVLDAEGSLYVKERKRDLIISGGENIYPAEIEAVLLTHPDIKEVTVIGVPSARWGESPAVIAVRRDGASLSADELLGFCRGRMAGYKIPSMVEFVDSLPRTVTGKVQKQQLRERFRGPAPE